MIVVCQVLLLAGAGGRAGEEGVLSWNVVFVTMMSRVQGQKRHSGY